MAIEKLTFPCFERNTSVIGDKSEQCDDEVGEEGSVVDATAKDGVGDGVKVEAAVGLFALIVVAGLEPHATKISANTSPNEVKTPPLNSQQDTPLDIFLCHLRTFP